MDRGNLHDAVDRELRALPEDIRASYQHICKMIGELGLDRVGMPHVRRLEGKLWEMRMKGRGDEARAIYVVVRERRLVVLVAFMKKTQKTPRRMIELALQREREIQP